MLLRQLGLIRNCEIPTSTFETSHGRHPIHCLKFILALLIENIHNYGFLGYCNQINVLNQNVIQRITSNVKYLLEP